MKKKILTVKNAIENRKNAAATKLADVNNKLSDDQKTALNGIIEECNSLLAELDAMEEETSNSKLLELVNNILASFASQMEEMKAENLANLQKLQNQLQAKKARKARKQMRIMQNKMRRDVPTNLVDLSDYTPDSDTEYVAGYRPVTGIMAGFTIGTTSKQSRKIRTLTKDGDSVFVSVAKHGIKPTIDMVGTQRIANMTKFAGIIQGVADEDLYEDGQLRASIEREGLAELDATKNGAALSLLTTAAKTVSNWTKPFVKADSDMRTQLLAVITSVRLQLGNRASRIAVAMNPAQWALLEDLRNENDTPISADLILNQVIKIEDATITGDNVLVWAADMAVYDIYRPAEMKWHDDGVRIVTEESAQFGEDTGDLVALVGEEEKPYVVNAYTAWQANEQDLLVEEMAIMYLRDTNCAFYDSLADVKTAIAS